MHPECDLLQFSLCKLGFEFKAIPASKWVSAQQRIQTRGNQQLPPAAITTLCNKYIVGDLKVLF